MNSALPPRAEVHGRTDYQFPQLMLERDNLDNVPPLHLPPGYTIRPYQNGDEVHWGRIMSEAFNPYWNARRFLRLMKPHYGFRPERVLFVCHHGEPVGSASAFRWPGVPADTGFVHMVGILRSHCGLGLGFTLASACLNLLKASGFSRATLNTEDFRLPAIKHYLRLGFHPVLVIEDQRAKWAEILQSLDRPDLIDAFGLMDMVPLDRAAVWWRVFQVTTYMNWLELRWMIYGAAQEKARRWTSPGRSVL